MTGATVRDTAAGRPWPLGVTADERGINVAVWAPEASRVMLCLFDADGAEERIVLPHRDGDVRHAHISGVAPGTRYGLRAEGPNRPADGLRFNPAKLLVDPYARALDGPLRWDPLMSGYASGPDDLVVDHRDSAPVVPKGIVAGAASGPDPAANRPGHALADLVVYEAHVKGISAAHPDVPEEIRGTYAGMADPAIVGHLSALGVNAVELLPVQAFLDDEYVVGKGLTNYWGYQPISWFAAEPRYAGPGRDADAELRRLVHTLHEAGIEVIVDVVYNHTGEGDERGPTLSLRGLHNTGYYRLLDEGRHYVDDTGTGNTLAVERPMVLRLVLDSLRHWVQHFGVDGFRFDLATAVGRTERGFEAAGAFFQAVRQDPVLAGVKLIAEPWDLGPGGYQLGHFPHPWSEWNDWFRDGVRRVWRGDPLGQVGLASALLGSAGRFDHSGRGTTASVNFVTAHDGFTLADVVSYAEKHNEANLEGNRDGHDDNHSDNFGVEGPSDDEQIVSARARRVRGMLATLLVSQGVPMLLAGDEIGNSQGGNNNVYAQDNETGWIDWSSPDAELLGFVRRLIDVRRRFPVLRQRAFLHGGVREDGHRDVVWRRADGEEPTPDDWHDPEFRTIAAELRGAAGDPIGEMQDDVVLVVLNVGGDVEIRLPEPGDGRSWRVEADSARPDAEGPASDAYPALAQSVVVMSAAREASDAPAPGAGLRENDSPVNVSSESDSPENGSPRTHSP
ncbi:glycogen debranching protein GlgX [Leucobacter sp. CSA1]|uniref:Glycogen debranching protein GlgX n=1 Tax=Leucobacter chromiisoli TaxID=2796471 RepID=A0A934UTJ6_9MICO|nr:glycogen debranching protein GlgX [Leucobacter chromiisoli]MBK0418474.1 glycogen debranching protein GlgX [Leucobacter chromiisoli]